MEDGLRHCLFMTLPASMHRFNSANEYHQSPDMQTDFSEYPKADMLPETMAADSAGPETLAAHALEQNKELRQTMAAKDQLYAVIAHDLRSPIGSIQMMLDVLIQNLSAEKIGSEMYELLLMSGRTAEETFALLDNLLKWTGSQTGRLHAVRQEVNLTDLVDNLTETLKPIAGRKRIVLCTEHPDVEELTVYADADMLKTVIRNLVGNAVKFSQEDSVIRIKAKVKENMAVVSVQDSGCGISEENQKKLLQTGVRFTTSGTHKEEGTGLGLLLCQNFVAQNGGKFWFASKSGEGSTFSFSVPLHKEVQEGP